MANLSLLVFPLAIFVLVFWGAKIAPKGEFSAKYLERDQMMTMRTFACFSIILHHLTQRITNYGSIGKGPITLYNHIGFLFTAIFFFSSGYGLLYSYLNKKNYLDGFLRKRLSAVLVPFILVNIVTILVNRIAYKKGVHDNFLLTLKQVLGIELLDGNGWFIVEIIVFYVLFTALFSIFKNKDVSLTLLILCVFAVIAFSFFRGHDYDDYKETYFMGEWWFNSTITFVYGLLYARFKDKIEAFFKKHYSELLISFFFLTFITTYLGIAFNYMFGYYHEMLPTYRTDALITLIAQSINCLVFVTFLLLINLKIAVGNGALEYFGKLQLMIFLVHGYFVRIVFDHTKIGHFKWYLLVFICSYAVSAVLGLLSYLIRKKLTDLLCAIDIKKFGGKTITYILAAALVGAMIFFAGKAIAISRYYDQEMKVLRSCSEGDVVYFGRFDTNGSRLGRERLEWIVLQNDGKRVCLLTKQGIASGYLNQKYEEVSWEGSDLRQRLNSEEFTKIFNEKELARIIERKGEVLSLLSADEAARYFATDHDRELSITDIAEAGGCNVNVLSKANNWDNKGYRSSWWWLKGDFGKKAITSPIVTVDGQISMTERYVNKPGGAIRPVIWVDISN
ncbi:acyltransferase [Butyrivibrio sp. CB08]|uniref:acyltransferase family protein n=1 Tax=Butyrivibrio sp. CB08 TaxID=2364879 RepID=UPI000EAA0DE1|nr:acyltransferase family protein [Butyrivibrio sp. CB08]RKM62174.1 acyltransferase [Butyrivibrio sp. CB08]